MHHVRYIVCDASAILRVGRPLDRTVTQPMAAAVTEDATSDTVIPTPTNASSFRISHRNESFRILRTYHEENNPRVRMLKTWRTNAKYPKAFTLLLGSSRVAAMIAVSVEDVTVRSTAVPPRT